MYDSRKHFQYSVQIRHCVEDLSDALNDHLRGVVVDNLQRRWKWHLDQDRLLVSFLDQKRTTRITLHDLRDAFLLRGNLSWHRLVCDAQYDRSLVERDVSEGGNWPRSRSK
jgi:hypothetical protein